MPPVSKPFVRIRSTPFRVLAGLILSLALFAALGLLVPNPAPGAAARFDGAPVGQSVKPDGSLNRHSEFGGTVDVSGWQATLDSRRGPILARQSGAEQAATDSSTFVGSIDPRGVLLGVPPAPSFWLPLANNGLNGPVLAFAVSGNDIYVGGLFQQTADGSLKNLGNIAKYNTNRNAWSALPNNGLNSEVNALAIIGGTLYVGGFFRQTGDGQVTDLNNIAQFSGGAWSALPKKGLSVGTGAGVYALAVSGNTLYVGGAFYGTFDSSNAPVISVDVIQFSGGAWSALPNQGLGGATFSVVYALAVNGSDLYVGGFFGSTADGVVTDLDSIARLSGGVWSSLPNKGLHGDVRAIEVADSGIYVGGNFNQTFDGAVTNLIDIARLSGAGWSAFPGNGLNGPPAAFAVNGSDLYVGGFFNQTADGAVGNLGNIAHFSTISNTWSAPPNKGLNNYGVSALAFSGNDLYVGGNFYRTVAAPQINLNYIAKLTNDTDGDGIPDDWERNGVTINGVKIDLPAMGADPLHKDLFVHADWLDSPGLKPGARDLQIVSDAFENAPLANPDGTSGVHLHVDLGPGSVMNPVTGATWGALSAAGMLPYQATIGSTVGGDYNWTDTDTIKQTNFDPAQRGGVFHYVCFCGNLGGLAGVSGIARDIPGHDFLVTLGGWPVVGGTSLQKAGTFMHELGHNLGLHHGGGDDVNLKPNHLSVMNYGFQVIGLLTPSGNHILRNFDYSPRQLPMLDETALVESVGIGDPNGHLTIWNIQQPDGSCQAQPDNYFSQLAYPATDWSCDGGLSPGTVQADVNGDGVCVGPGQNGVPDTIASGDDVTIGGGFIIAGPNRKCETLASGDDTQEQAVGFQQPNQLTGFDDWSAVRFDAGGQIGQPPASLFAPRSLAPSDVITTTVDEPTYQKIKDSVPPALFDAETTSPIDVVSYSPANGFAPLAVGFDGGASTTPTGTVTSWVWNFGDGAVNSGITVTHAYTVPGVYFATLSVTNSNGDVNLVALRHRVTVTAGSRLFIPLIQR